MRLIVVLLCILAVSGCSKKVSTPAASAPATRTPSGSASVSALPFRGNPSDVLVEVDGTKLIRGDADTETEYKLAGAMGQIPPDQIEAAREQVRHNVIEQFVYRTILRNEADRQKIVVSKEDEDKAFKEIATQLPPGLTVEEAMKNSPRGEAAMRDEVLTGIRIKKLLDPLMTNSVEITEKEVADFMALYKNNLTMPEMVRARHILITTAPGDDDKVKADKKKKTDDVRQKLVDGGDFAKLAAEYSDCPSKQRGGDLGPFTRDRMVKPFADAAFSQDVNAIGPVIETQFGYHIIQVTEHNQAGMASREKIEDAVRGQKRQQSMKDFMDTLRTKANIKYSSDAAPAAAHPVLSAPFPAAPTADKKP